jgi:prefoldin subunit 5
MAPTAASLSKLLQIKMAISFNTMQLSRVSTQYEAIHKSLDKMTRYEDKYLDAIDKAQDTDATINKAGFKKDKGEVWSDAKAEAYAHAVVKQYDENILIELGEEDMNFEALKTTLETSLTELNAEKEAWAQQTSQSASDTGLLSQ